MDKFLKFNFGTKLYMFRTVPLSIIRSFSLYTQQWYMSYKFADSLREGSGRTCMHRRRYEYAGPRADHDRAGPRADHDSAGTEYRYLDWYATSNTHYV